MVFSKIARITRINTGFQNKFIIIIVYSNWFVTWWQWLFYIYTKYEIGY